MKRVLPLLLLPLAALAFWLSQKRNDAPAVPFVKVTRETIVSTLSTNGKVEPVEFQDVRVETSGLVTRVLVRQGDAVQTGQTMAMISETGLGEELQAAEAREAQASADLQTLRQGGKASEIAGLEGQMSRAREDRAIAQRNAEALGRLVAKEAATRVEAEQAVDKVRELDTEITSLERRRTSLVNRNDLAGAQARVRETAASVSLARQRIAHGRVVAPIAGTVYDLPVRIGAYLNKGDPVASVGKLNPVRVRVYVDEPEVGRVVVGQPVRITWDAIQGKEWEGRVDRRPTEIVPLGTRQVGEVLCIIDNPGSELVPGTNVNAFIQTSVANGALGVPKAALRNDNGVGVYLLGDHNQLQWRNVKTGVDSALRIEILSGLNEGDAVALQTDQALKPGMRVTPLWQ